MKGMVSEINKYMVGMGVWDAWIEPWMGGSKIGSNMKSVDALVVSCTEHLQCTK